MTEPYRIKFNGVGPVSDEGLQLHIAAALASGFPLVERTPRLVPLAVVGGGPSVLNHLNELSEWKGDIWAINQTATWLASKGIVDNVYMFTVDPGDDLPQWTDGVERALLASICHPKLFEKLKGKDVRIFHTEHYRDADLQVTGGSSSACRVAVLALAMKYSEVVYFGCEGSFQTVTHAYRDENELEVRPKQLIIKAGEHLYRTGPDYLVTSEYLEKIITTFPDYFKERSGGLLRAMINNPDSWEVVALSESLKNELDPGAQPYVFPS